MNNNPCRFVDSLGHQACCDVKSKKMTMQYDPEKECCTRFDVFSKQDTTIVQVCIRKADVPAGNIAASFGLYHMWILSPFLEVGLGPNEGGVPGGNSGDLSADNPFAEAAVNDHTGEALKAGTKCFAVEVKSCCIAKELKEGPTGKSCAAQNCNMWAEKTIEKCGGSMGRIWEEIRWTHFIDLSPLVR